MESKDLHLGLLKKKVAELEDLLREKGRVEVERDENSLRYKKLVKHNDKLQRELLDYKQQVTSLKAKLLEASELRVSLLNRSSYSLTKPRLNYPVTRTISVSSQLHLRTLLLLPGGVRLRQLRLLY